MTPFHIKHSFYQPQQKLKSFQFFCATRQNCNRMAGLALAGTREFVRAYPLK
jgi:hypothetical protein